MTEMAEVKFQLYSLRARGFPPNDQITLASNNLQVGVMTKTLDIYTLHMSQMLYAGQSARPSVTFLSDF